LVPFSKDPRACLGLNLAYAEMCLTLAHVIRRFDMKIEDVAKEKDIDVVRDCIVGLLSEESRRVRVRIVGEDIE